MDIHSELVESLEKCISACNYCAAACLEEDNVESLTECIRLNLDCADTCYWSLQLLTRDSDYLMDVMEICKNICAECAAECEMHEHDHCRECADACTGCEEHCRNYINQ